MEHKKVKVKEKPVHPVKKAIITCGGYATRFLPITKAIPKEMLPIGDKPVIHYIIEELKNAGITDVLILVGRGREVLQNYFDRFPELEQVLSKKKTQDEIDNLVNPFKDLNIYYHRVGMPRGSADNIYHAKSFVGSDPFLVAYCDDIFVGNDDNIRNNPSIELIKDYHQNSKPNIIVTRVPASSASNYGIVSPKCDAKCPACNFTVGKIVEKPKDPPSNFAFCGRFIMTKELFDFIENDMLNLENQNIEEVCLVKQLNKLCQSKGLRAVQTRCKRFDVGYAEGLYKANEYYFTKKSTSNS